MRGRGDQHVEKMGGVSSCCGSGVRSGCRSVGALERQKAGRHWLYTSELDDTVIGGDVHVGHKEVCR